MITTPVTVRDKLARLAPGMTSAAPTRSPMAMSYGTFPAMSGNWSISTITRTNRHHSRHGPNTRPFRHQPLWPRRLWSLAMSKSLGGTTPGTALRTASGGTGPILTVLAGPSFVGALGPMARTPECSLRAWTALRHSRTRSSVSAASSVPPALSHWFIGYGSSCGDSVSRLDHRLQRGRLTKSLVRHQYNTLELFMANRHTSPTETP